MIGKRKWGAECVGKRTIHIKKKWKKKKRKHSQRIFCVSGSLITLWDGLVENFLANANSDMSFYFADIHFFSSLYSRSLYASLSHWNCIFLFFAEMKETRRNSFGYVLYTIYYSAFLSSFQAVFSLSLFLLSISFSYHQKYLKSGLYNTTQLKNIHIYNTFCEKKINECICMYSVYMQ